MLSPLPRAKRGKNPRQPEQDGELDGAPAAEEENQDAPQAEPVAQTPAGNGKPVGTEAFASLELKPRH
jgi:hypothetical protein